MPIGDFPPYRATQQELFDGRQYEVSTSNMNQPLEVHETTIVEREFDEQGRITKETTTVSKPKTLPKLDPYPGTEPWRQPYRWPTQVLG